MSTIMGGLQGMMNSQVIFYICYISVIKVENYYIFRGNTWKISTIKSETKKKIKKFKWFKWKNNVKNSYLW